jgi:4-methyl-5(b-hydroxyethyl)-thiazole monophosphate biosynthesis
MPSVLAILAEGFEEVEALAPIDLLRRAGATLTVAALPTGNIHVTGRSGVTLHADTTLDAVGAELFDCLLLPGGPGVKNLRADARVMQATRRHADAGKWIAAICAAPTVLKDAGLLQGRRFTAHFSVAGELPDYLADQKVVVDGRLVTSRGAGTALDFALMLVQILFSAERSAEIGRSISA